MFRHAQHLWGHSVVFQTGEVFKAKAEVRSLGPTNHSEKGVRVGVRVVQRVAMLPIGSRTRVPRAAFEEHAPAVF